jgi:DNA-directed RNA polymerase subunit RPC12/RpoP
MLWIENRLPCPRCGHKRFVQQARYVYVCFQCHNTWSSTRPDTRLDAVLAQFLPHELARLIAYRGVVQCGLYTDWPVTEADESQMAGPSQRECDRRSDEAPRIVRRGASVRIEP